MHGLEAERCRMAQAPSAAGRGLTAKRTSGLTLESIYQGCIAGARHPASEVKQ